VDESEEAVTQYVGDYVTADGKRTHVNSTIPPAKAKVKPNSDPTPGPIGNTEGIIAPDTKPNPYGNSAPEIKATEKEKSAWERWGSAATHGVLGLAGFVPGLNVVSSIADAAVYGLEGEGAEAAIALAGVIPGEKWVAAGAKGVKALTKTEKAVKEGEAVAKEAKAAKKAADEAEMAKKAAQKKAEQEAAEEGAEQAATKPANGKGGGNDKGSSKPKQKRKPRQPREYEKKVVNEDGSVTYTLKTKDGNLVDVTYSREGYPDFSKYKYDGGLGKSEVKIEVTGNNTTDFKRANEAAGFGDKAYSHPDGYTWHHNQDGTTMELVRTDVHSASPHTGGASAARGGN
jgi:hypothetical protein